MSGEPDLTEISVHCPPDFLKRGGHSGGCQVHSYF